MRPEVRLAIVGFSLAAGLFGCARPTRVTIINWSGAPVTVRVAALDENSSRYSGRQKLIALPANTQVSMRWGQLLNDTLYVRQGGCEYGYPIDVPNGTGAAYTDLHIRHDLSVHVSPRQKDLDALPHFDVTARSGDCPPRS